MKKIIFLLAFALMLVSANAQKSFHYQVSNDTLTDADTITMVIDINDLHNADFYYSMHVQADSVTGATAATGYLQLSDFSSGDYWYSADTVTIDGVQTIDWSVGTLQAMRARLYFISSGTQSTALKYSIRGVQRK